MSTITENDIIKHAVDETLGNILRMGELLCCKRATDDSGGASTMTKQYTRLLLQEMERRTWTPAYEPPDDNTTVLANAPAYDEPTFVAYIEAGTWYDAQTGDPLDPATHPVMFWRHFPAEPYGTPHLHPTDPSDPSNPTD